MKTAPSSCLSFFRSHDNRIRRSSFSINLRTLFDKNIINYIIIFSNQANARLNR